MNYRTYKKQTMKIVFENIIKRFELCTNINELKRIVIDNFNLINVKFNLSYYDEENDSILIENQKDYQNALKFAKNVNNKVIKIYVQTFGYQKTEDQIGNLGMINEKTEKVFSSFYFVMKCPLCERNFENKKSFLKHSKICFSVFGTKREPFNSRLQRTRHFRISNKMKTNRCLRYITKSKIYNWREMSANLKVQIKKWKNSFHL